MHLNESDQIAYLANIIFLAKADGQLSPKAAAALEEIRSTLGAKKSTFDAAVKRASSGAFSPMKAGNFAAQVSNLSDMLYVAIVDESLSDADKDIIAKFSNNINLTEEQRLALSHDAIERLKAKELSPICPHCKARIAGEPRYCPNCGADLASRAPNAELEVPSAGYAIEFCKSTSASFPTALKLAQSAHNFSTSLRNKKNWYLASWPTDAFQAVTRLAESLTGIRNKKCYKDGSEIDWDDLFGFVWCAEQRNRAFRPTEYCFGKTDNHLNPWGCKQVRLDWAEWARWFSYGRFEKRGILRGGYIWVFDKSRIRHEILTNVQRFRFCPHLRLPLMDAVLRALPDQVAVTEGGPWKYNRNYEEAPGSIKITEIDKSNGMEFKQEYFADGVRPHDLSVLTEILKKALAEAGITDISAKQIVG